jgi:hypothetical protein
MTCGAHFAHCTRYLYPRGPAASSAQRPKWSDLRAYQDGGDDQGWAKLVLIALERYSVALKRLTFNLR